MIGATKREITGERSLDFSSWHRRYLEEGSYNTDLDGVESRYIDGELRNVALIEAKEGKNAVLCGLQRESMIQLSHDSGLPLYFVRYLPPWSYKPPGSPKEHADFTFWIERIHPESAAGVFHLNGVMAKKWFDTLEPPAERGVCLCTK